MCTIYMSCSVAVLFIKVKFIIILGSYNPIGSQCSDFYKAGIIPNPGTNQCLHLTATNRSKIRCCHNNIVPADDGTMCPENLLGIEEHCYTVNKLNREPVNDTAINSERHCQENGGNLVHFTSLNAIDMMSDIFMSHPYDSFSLVKHPLFTGPFTNPHFPFSSTSSGKALTNITIDPRYMNETANDLGECTIMEYVASFEEYSTMDQPTSVADYGSSNESEPWYWIPKHQMNLWLHVHHQQRFTLIFAISSGCSFQPMWLTL